MLSYDGPAGRGVRQAGCAAQGGQQRSTPARSSVGMLLWKQYQSPAGNNETETPRAGNNSMASLAAHLSSEMEKLPMIDSILTL